MVKETRQKELSRILAHLDTLYELGEDCIHPDTGVIVLDPQYDDLLAELQKLDPKHVRFTRPSDSKATSSATKIKNDPPLTSISKASHENLAIQTEQFKKWMATASGEDLYIEYKLDGICLRLYYEAGILTKASTRPRDGIWGDDVTEQVKHVQNIPQKLNLPETCAITGELLCFFKDFDLVQKDLKAKGEKLRANPRNHAAGAIRNFKEPEKVKDMRLTFIAYSIENHEDPPYKTETERAKWVNQKLGIRYVRAAPFNKLEQLQELEDLVSKLDYAVDGAIVGVDNLENQEQMGRHGDVATGNPKGKVAWKFRSEQADVPVTSIDIKTGRTGKITPVSNFVPVPLAGTMVTRATLHNFGFVKEKGIKVGTVIKITKAGEIIPKVIDVVSGAGIPDIPTHCPSCGSKVDFVQSSNDATKWELVCGNSLHCPAQQVGRMLNYLSSFGVLGLGEATVTQLVEGKLLKEFADFYTLSVDEVMKCGLSIREATLACAAIHMIPNPDKIKDNDKLLAKLNKTIHDKKKIPLAKLIGAFGIKGVGETTGRVLVEHFKSFDEIRKASMDELVEVGAVGETTAEALYTFFNNWHQNNQIIDLLKHVEPELPKTGKFSGKTFVLSGKVDKKTLKAQIEDLGGNVSGSVGSKTTFLVAGEGSGSKSSKAEELGVAILSVADFTKMLDQ